jgi:hypothetical protein
VPESPGVVDQSDALGHERVEGGLLERSAQFGRPGGEPGEEGPASGLTAKDLRPYATSKAKEQGYSLEELKIGLAHTSVTTTEGYVQQHSTPVSQVTLRLPRRP